MSKELPVGRKYLLMLRDGLVQTLAEKHKEWRKKCFDETLTREVEQLKKKVKDKWNARLYWPETTLQGVTDLWLVTSCPYVAVRDERDNARRGEHLFINKETGKMTFLKCKGLVSCSPHEIPIVIDPTILTLNDKRAIKEAVWDIVEPEIGKHKKRIKDRDFAVPAKEPEALAPILRCRQKTFDNHLRRYDQWMRGLRFRTITYVELTLTDPVKREELFLKHVEARHRATIITSSMPADLRRSITAKENAVRKGVDLIFYAIHRTKRVADIPPEEITATPDSGRPHKCTHNALSCQVDCPSPKDCASFQKLLQACQTS